MSARMYRLPDGRMVNMYDCTICPRCESTYRYTFKGEIICDDCGYSEPFVSPPPQGEPAASPGAQTGGACRGCAGDGLVRISDDRDITCPRCGGTGDARKGEP